MSYNVRKIICRAVGFLLIAIFTGLILPASPYAAGYEQYRIEVDRTLSPAVVTIEWEGEASNFAVQVTSPDGRMFGSAETPERVAVLGGVCHIGIDEATAGTWTVQIAGSGFIVQDVGIDILPSYLFVHELAATHYQEGVNITWNLSHTPDEIDVELFAGKDTLVFDENNAVLRTSLAGQLPAAGYLIENSELERLGNGIYTFAARFTGEAGQSVFERARPGIIIHDREEEGLPALQDVSAVHDEGEIKLSWAEASGPEEFPLTRIYVVDPENSSLIYTEDVYGNFASVPFPGKPDTVLAGAAPLGSYGKVGPFTLFEVTRNGEIQSKVHLPENLLTKDNPYVFLLDMAPDEQVDVYVNEELAAGGITQAGELGVPLAEGSNDVDFVFHKAGQQKQQHTVIQVDTAPPPLYLTLPKLEDGIAVTDRNSIEIAGSSEEGAVILLGGDELTQDGRMFSRMVSLLPGENLIRLVASDAAGNSTVMDIVVRQGGEALAGTWQEIVHRYRFHLIGFLVLLLLSFLIRHFFREKPAAPAGRRRR